MKLLNLRGIPKSKNVKKYLIDWEAKSLSKFQKEVKDWLYPFWKNHAVYEEFPVFGSKMRIDFLNFTKKIAVEVQGRQHTKYVEFFHGDRFNYAHQMMLDEEKNRFCHLNGFRLIEIFDEDRKKFSKEFFEELLNDE